MNINIIQQRLESYAPKTSLEEENALKEITQEIVLMALAQTTFFKEAEFLGGTALRILYGLPRFSEDLDFALSAPNKHFDLPKYFATITEELKAYGYDIAIQDRSKANLAVKKAFIKDNSIGKVLTFEHPNIMHLKKIKIKLEIDVNPPAGAQSEIKYLDFPLAFGVRVQTLASSFAGKIHALLCRTYMKGRDWFDFVWYVARQPEINYALLHNALIQSGPWKNKTIQVNKEWILQELEKKIIAIDWHTTKNDVKQFLQLHDQKSLEVWSKDFFLSRLEKLNANLK